jgi:biotin carboxyl carrier protein
MSEYTLRIGDRDYAAEVREMTADHARVAVDGVEYRVDLVGFGRPRPAVPTTSPARVATPSTSAATLPPVRPSAASAPAGAIAAPLPGLILEIKVKEGDTVQAGQALLVMEAMKMENVVPASHNGTVRKIFVIQGDSVSEGDPLVEISRPEMTTL